jgi:hypothetical protein
MLLKPFFFKERLVLWVNMKLFIIFLSILCFQSNLFAAEPFAFEASMQKSKEMAQNGHRFYQSLICMDGSTPNFISVGLKKSETGEKIDTYKIQCKDGLIGTFEWSQDQKTYPSIPSGFRMKTQAEVNAFKIRGRVNEISVSPNGKIWLTTAVGLSYFTDGLENKWSTATLSADQHEYADDIGRITFFNDEVAIATGGLSGRVYRTENSGRNWSETKATSEQNVYTVYSTPHGSVWTAGSSGVIEHSLDFGKKWKALAVKFSNDNRVHSIFMGRDLSGIAGSLDGDELRVTLDNWSTSKKVTSPKGQGLVPARVRDSISKVAIIGDKYLLQQAGSVFLSARSPIRWSKFKDLNVVDFAFSEEAKRIFLVDETGYVYQTTDLVEVAKVSADRIGKHIIDLKAVGDSLYALDAEKVIYRINSSKFEKAPPFP